MRVMIKPWRWKLQNDLLGKWYLASVYWHAGVLWPFEPPIKRLKEIKRYRKIKGKRYPRVEGYVRRRSWKTLDSVGSAVPDNLSGIGIQWIVVGQLVRAH